MPQRITQISAPAGRALDVNGRALTASHEQIAAILRARLGQAHGDLLATPAVDAAGGITWSTALAGPVVPAADLPQEDRVRLEQRATRLLGDIRGLGAQLQSEGAAAQLVGRMVALAAETPAGQWLYSVGGKPVLVMWGHADGDRPMPPPVATAVPIASAPAVTAASRPGAAPAADPAAQAIESLAASQIPPPAPPPPPPPAELSHAPSRKGLWAALALLLIGAVLLAFGYLHLRGEDEALARQIAEAEEKNKAMEAELAARRARVPQMMCVAEAEPPAPPASEPEVAEAPASAPDPEPEPPPEPASAPPVVASAPEPVRKPDPYEALGRRIEASAKRCDELQRMIRDEPLLQGKEPQAVAAKKEALQRLQSNCREDAIREARNQCPGQRPPELAPQVVMVFDASGSMRESLPGAGGGGGRAVDPGEEILRQIARAGGVNLPRTGGGGPTRIEAARDAAVSVARRVPSDMSIGLVTVENCPAANEIGFFSPAQRGRLIAGLQGIQPRSGTPLADGVAKAGAMVDGVGREAVMVVISDGQESCGRADPCAAAAQLARRKPHLKINVVDITGVGAGNCLAQATGGRVFTARSADEVAAMTRRAAEDAMGPANCPR